MIIIAYIPKEQIKAVNQALLSTFYTSTACAMILAASPYLTPLGKIVRFCIRTLGFFAGL